MFNNYYVSIAVIALSITVNTIATLTGNFPIWTTVFYLLSPICFLLMGLWFFQEYQMKLLRQTLDSFIGSKATKTELSAQKHH
jgi:uncharacterized membrane protein YuzA (DUF378 family)